MVFESLDKFLFGEWHVKSKFRIWVFSLVQCFFFCNSGILFKNILSKLLLLELLPKAFAFLLLL